MFTFHPILQLSYLFLYFNTFVFIEIIITYKNKTIMVNNNEKRKGADEYDLLIHQSSHHECSVDNVDKIKKC